MYDISIKVTNYKSFKEASGFDSIERVNLIIGRNNVGKSALLDIIESITAKEYSFEESTWNNNKAPQIIVQTIIDEESIIKTFPSNLFTNEIGMDHLEYGMQYKDIDVAFSIEGKKGKNRILLSCDDNRIQPSLLDTEYSEPLVGHIPIKLETKIFKKVLAERNIIPELDDKINIKSDGSGITNAIQHFLNKSNLPSKIVEEEILNALNTIFAHDITFTGIVCQIHVDKTWEIYLREKIKGRIALSKSGSGIKTVMIVLVYLLLIPKLENKALNEYVFAFEELENNIHPALLRRLNNYIYRLSVEENFIYFLTTHSNVLIDQYSTQRDAQIIHVTQSEEVSKCKTVKTYIENNGVLDDLDVRASDILQANGIIWVEGPSDRIYVNKWIELWSNGKLKEGTHYQIIFYGGRLLSHLSADTPEEINDGISILNTNRNAIIIIDSDKRNAQTRVNTTKERIKQEFNDLDSMCWITKGKEIENYISREVVDTYFELEDSSQVEKYDSFFDYLENLKEGKGKKYEGKKPLLAEKLIQKMTKENMQSVLDLDDKMQEMCTRIESWNR